MNHKVYLTDGAERDLLDIYDYVAVCDTPGKADDLLEKLEATCDKLTYSPKKGHIVPELKRVDVDLYRELHYKPYRIIYGIEGKKIYVYAILDGRRDLQSLLERRLLR